MKIALTFLGVILIAFLIVWQMPSPNFSEEYGFPCLGQFIKGKFYVNPARLQEVDELYKDIKTGKKITLSEKEKKMVVQGVNEYIRTNTVAGQAFVYFNGTDLSPYSNGKHLVQ